MKWLSPSAESTVYQSMRTPIGMLVGGATRAAEWLVSPRGLILMFFLAAGWLATAGWIRPVMSEDIRAIHLPLGVWSDGAEAGEMLRGPRRVPADSIGGFLLLAAAAGAIVTLWRPRYFGAAAGLLLSLALCANAATALNHPALVYLLDLELEQRQQIAGVYFMADNDPVTGYSNDRLSGEPYVAQSGGAITGAGIANVAPKLNSAFLPDVDAERGHWEHGFFYLLRGPYLILLAFVGFMIGRGGPVGRRLRDAALFALLGTLAAGLVCIQRLRADFYWQRAKTLEARCDFEGARAAIESCRSACPAFDQRQETWLLVGKLDVAEGKDTSAQQYFRAFQAYRDKRYLGPVACLQDLPAWPITQTPDLRERRWAVGVMDDVVYRREVPVGPAADQAARFWAQIGLSYYLQEPLLAESGFRYLRRDRGLTTALDAWRRASELSPASRESLLGQGLVLARVDRDNPQRARDAFHLLLPGLADRPLRADILTTLGDSYLEAGQFPESIDLYSRSADAYSLPKIVNHGALKGLGGW